MKRSRNTNCLGDATPVTMAIAVVLASAATLLGNAWINSEISAAAAPNAVAPTHSTPRAFPLPNSTHAEAKL